MLVLSSNSREASATCRALIRFGHHAVGCGAIDELCRGIAEGAGGVVIAHESLAGAAKGVLRKTLSQQPAGADFPLLILVDRRAGGNGTAADDLIADFDGYANAVIMERPVRPATLGSTAGALLRARRRVVEDITDRREAQEALLASEERFRAVQELSLDAFSSLSAVRDESNRIVDFSWLFVNEAAAQILHRKPHELIGRRLFEVLSDHDNAGEVFARCLQVVETGESYELEVQYDSDSGPGWFRNAAVKLGDGVAVYFSDITERKRAEVALQASESRFRGTFENATVGLAHVGLDGRWLLVNPKLQEIVGYRENELLKLRFQDITHPDDLREQAKFFQLLVRGEIGQYAMEKRYFHRDGHTVWVHVTAALQRGPEGNPWYLITAVEDITKRKESERQLKELNETLEQRVAERTAIAEQRATLIRTLAGRLTQTEQRERRRLAQILHDHLQQLLVAAKLKAGVLRRKAQEKEMSHSLGQITELLNQSIEASRSLTVELSPPILYDAGLVSALEWLAGEMREKHGLMVSVEAERDAEPDAEDTRTLLFQAVRELLFNVVKHARADRATVAVSRSESERIQITVSDAGVGFSLNKSASDGNSKLGFGLLSLRERLEWIDGRLELDSAPGQGTRAMIVAPRLSTPQLVGGRESVGPRVPTGVGRPKTRLATNVSPAAAGRIRVVIAEDHELLREGLRGVLLAQPDIDLVGEAVNGRGAVELALATCPDVVMMDVVMPGLNGVDATRRIMAELPNCRVIGLSMYQEEQIAAAMRAAGAVGYLPKDAPLETILAAIRGKPTVSEDADAIRHVGVDTGGLDTGKGESVGFDGDSGRGLDAERDLAIAHMQDGDLNFVHHLQALTTTGGDDERSPTPFGE